MTKGPDDQPIDFNLDGFVNSQKLPDFRFHFSGKRWTMAHFSALDRQETEKVIADDYKTFRLAMGDEQFEEFKATPLNNGAFQELVKRYFKHSGVEQGES